MSLEKLHVMPVHVKGDGGYFYDNKYVGKTFQFENKLIHFTESSFQEYPLELYNIIKSDIEEEHENIKNDIKNIKAQLDDSMLRIGTLITSHAEKLDEMVTRENIENIIDNKLNDVYRAFEKLSEKLVKDNLDNALKDSKREASGKMKLTSLVVFKELGYSPSEIKELAVNGLI